jgi:hypothetical protein
MMLPMLSARKPLVYNAEPEFLHQRFSLRLKSLLILGTRVGQQLLSPDFLRAAPARIALLLFPDVGARWDKPFSDFGAGNYCCAYFMLGLCGIAVFCFKNRVGLNTYRRFANIPRTMAVGRLNR